MILGNVDGNAQGENRVRGVEYTGGIPRLFPPTSPARTTHHSRCLCRRLRRSQAVPRLLSTPPLFTFALIYASRFYVSRFYASQCTFPHAGKTRSPEPVPQYTFYYINIWLNGLQAVCIALEKEIHRCYDTQRKYERATSLLRAFRCGITM